MLKFEVLKDKQANILLKTRDGCMADFAPQNILKFEPNSILFDEQDRQPSDKIFRFLRESAEAPWKLQLMDYVPNSSLKSDRIHNPFSLNPSS